MQVTFEITKDVNLLKQYFILRERTFKRVLGLSQFDGSQEAYDAQSNIFIARIGNHVIGGVRILGSDTSSSLPLEKDSVSLSKQLPELNLDAHLYCQWMRFTLTQETDVPHKELHRDFFLALAVATHDLGYRYGFCVSSKVHQRLYKQTFAKIGYVHQTCRDVMVESEQEFDDLEHMLCVTHLAPCYQERISA